MNKIRINIYADSIIGSRSVNQDYIGTKTNIFGDKIAIVCDGIGSLKLSEQASKMITNTFLNKFSSFKRIRDPRNWFKKTLKTAINNLQKLSMTKLNNINIGTTLALFLMIKNQYFCFNIGDSRIYKITENDMVQISLDHNYKNYLIMKNASAEAIQNSEKDRTRLTNFIDCVNIDRATFDFSTNKIKAGDKFLICSDGLYNFLSQSDIQNLINDKNHKANISKDLNKKAFENKSLDNISNILICTKV